MISKTDRDMQPRFYFHVTKLSRDKYAIEDTLFSIKGRVVFANFSAVKILAQKMNTVRNSKKNPDKAVSPSLINAMGLLDEIFHYVIENYRKRQKPKLLEELNSDLENKFDNNQVGSLFKTFVSAFPITPVYLKQTTADDYIASQTDGFKNREILIEELIVQWLQNQNQAYKTVKELIDDHDLNKTEIYPKALNYIKKYFNLSPKVSSTGFSLIEMLLKPSQLYPDSVYDQIKYMYENWGDELKPFLSRMLLSLDFFKEEAKRFIPDMFGKSLDIPSFHDDIYHFEPEAFSQDEHWMPRLVLIAKSTYVWLDQLSKQYKREIRTLDQIPNEELNRLANFGFTGLWLIGLWERSTASKKIKQINGNPEAVASAYSLKNYDIANDIGGYEAYQNLKERAWQRGIRLASDMVPNHMAIDSDWVRNHPHWFIQSDHPPFPNHSFNGPDLSDHNNMQIFIEDGYWSKSDAAVAFKRIDKYTGNTIYIYHGNDGTGMPWNDTAQLNYMLKEVREAVINTILHVARMFPIIRFDAAMTLAKKHYQRLWFPLPGSGGDIPTRAQYSLSRQEFDKHFPEEFWREVVDRVKQECPDTLLLAEAFWMMEGYFVRSLGMHRVYNSAFMNLLKNEDNAHYRELIRNVLEFNPQILKRYVNFMNNPDEDTAIAQFGKDDKYFGVCVLMCTMPGLPMFGHGQIEGFHEKYGMEYKRAYWDEAVDQDLVDRHRREIVPLLKKRKLFSDVENFYMFNFFVGDAGINENVFCFSNMHEEQRGLVLYNNVYQSTAGWVKESVGYNDGFGNIVYSTLVNALRLNAQHNHYAIFSDEIHNIEYIRGNMDLAHNGLFAELKGYNFQVFSSIREVYATEENPYDKLHDRLQGRGVISIEESLHELKIEPIINALNNLFSKENIDQLLSGKANKKLIDSFEISRQKILDFSNVLVKRSKPKMIVKNLPSTEQIEKKLNSLKPAKSNKTLIDNVLKKNLADHHLFYIYMLQAGFVLNAIDDDDKHIYYKTWLFEKVISQNSQMSAANLTLLRLLINYRELFLLLKKSSRVKNLEIFQIPDVRNHLKINFYDEVYYLNKECWEELLDSIFVVQLLENIATSTIQINKIADMVKRVLFLKQSAVKAGYDLTKLINAISV